MRLDKSSLKREIDKEIRTVQQMRILVAAAKSHQAKKNRDFHCEVFAATKTPQTSELCTYLRYIIQQGPHKTSSRINILNMAPDTYHWNAIQAQWIDGRLHIFLLDAAGHSDIKYSLNAILAACPNAVFYLCKSNTQSDSESCAFFALHNIISLFKMEDLFVTLRDIHREKSSAHPPYEISIDDFPAKFGALIQNIQSLTKYSKLTESHQYFRHSEDKTVSAYMKKHKRYSTLVHKYQNYAINYTKQKYRELAKQWIEALDNEETWRTSTSSPMQRMEYKTAMQNKARIAEFGLINDLDQQPSTAFSNSIISTTLRNLLWNKLTRSNQSLRVVGPTPITNTKLNNENNALSSDLIHQFCVNYEAKVYKNYLLNRISSSTFCLGKWVGTFFPVGGVTIHLSKNVTKRVPHTVAKIWSILTNKKQNDSEKIVKIRKLLSTLPPSWKRPDSVQKFYNQLLKDLKKMAWQEPANKITHSNVNNY